MRQNSCTCPVVEMYEEFEYRNTLLPSTPSVECTNDAKSRKMTRTVQYIEYTACEINLYFTYNIYYLLIIGSVVTHTV